MRETRSPRQFGLKDGARSGAGERERPINLTFGPAGEVSNDRAEFDATREWLRHFEAGHFE